MKFKYNGVLLVCALLWFASCLQAAQKKDPRYLPISAKELQQRVQKTPIDSPQHALLTARANIANLQKVAYDQYTAIWKRKPNDGHANLRRGIAAQNYWQHILHSTKISGTERFPALFYDLQRTARQCLHKASTLLPDSSSAQIAYGFFLWQWDNQMEKGLTLLKKAVSLSPKDARARANLGSVYAKRSGNAYDPQKAEEELKLASRLDPTYAYPHWLLVSLYINTHQYKNAQQAMQTYLNLTPPAARQGMKLYQSVIEEKLGKR
jgi:tetratricopeptide (TPR) repeat protein